MAFLAGVTLRHLGLVPPAPSFLALLLLPILAWCRRRRRPADASPRLLSVTPPARRWLPLLVAVAGGWFHGDGFHRDRARDCRLTLQEGDSVVVAGVVSGAWSRGPLVAVRSGLPGGCRTELRVRGGGDGPVRQGEGVRVAGRWRSWAVEGGNPEMAGEVRGTVEMLSRDPAAAVEPGLARWRERVRERLEVLFPQRHGLVAALVLARKDGIAPGLREAFTLAGVAHLLAISGFHVGVIAVVVLGSLRAAGVRKRPAAVAGTLVVWAYVAFIGAPDAAVRAALLLGLVGAGVLRGRPVHRAGALASALLLFTVVDPGAPGRAGFQLSFLGAAGLVFLGPILDGGLERRFRWRRAAAVRSAVAVGMAATLATLPAVAWHFDRVSVVGIPVTLAATPLVALALPGVLATVAVDAVPLVPEGVVRFLAGGADLLLIALVEIVRHAAALPWATAWVPRGVVVAGCLGAACGALLLPPSRGVGRDVRLTMAVGGAIVAGLLLGPVGTGLASGTLEIALLDVGQGDAIAIRSPRGRWLLLDAGPARPWGSDGDPPVLGRLRSRGVRRLAGLLLSHPDLDHIGGADAVIEAFRPMFVAGPGHPRGTDAYMAGLAAGSHPWLVLRSGDSLAFDGAVLSVLHPAADPVAGADPNASSLVLLLRYGGFTALLTGDAPDTVEEGIAEEAGDVDLLKVAHHGSLTSSSAAFLDAVAPEVALISAGRRNRFGHPHPTVVARLESRSATVFRTDLSGGVRVLVGREGEWRVVRERTR